MKKQALIFGLTASLYAFVFTWIGGGILVWLDVHIPRAILTLVMLVASYFLARRLADLVEGEDEPPPVLGALLLYSAGFFLLMQFLMGVFGVSFGFGRLGMFTAKLTQWCLVGTCLFTTRFIQPRIMLFLGIAAFAMQFRAAMVLGLFAMRVPEWALELITFLIAVLIARWLCFREESPADRVGNPLFLWLFSATGVMSLIITVHEMLLPVIVQEVVWLVFLASFVLLVRQIEPDDPDHKGSALGAPYSHLFCVFIALFSVVGSVFHFSDTVGEWIPYTASSGVHIWLPVAANALAALVIMVFLQLGQRMRPEGPGRTALFWGVALYFVAVLAGGSIFGVVSPNGRFFDLLPALVWLVLLVVPIMIAATMLMGIGLLRILFTLDHRPH